MSLPCVHAGSLVTAKQCSVRQADGNICLHNYSSAPFLQDTRQALIYSDLFLYFQGNTAAWWLLLELLQWPEGRCEQQEEAAGGRRRWSRWMQVLHCEGCISSRQEIYPRGASCGEGIYMCITRKPDYRGCLIPLRRAPSASSGDA